MQTFVPVSSISSWSQPLKHALRLGLLGIQHDKMNSICSDTLLYVDGKFDYAVHLYLYRFNICL